MTPISRALLAVMLTAPMTVAAVAQDAANADMTCAEFIELDEEGRTQAMEAMATEAGMEQADEETTGMHLADMTEDCTAAPDMAVMDAYMNAMDNPG